jgi:hypothetical protein
MDGLALQVLFGDPAVNGELANEMCLGAASRELGFDALGLRDEQGGAGQEEVAAEG